MRLIANGINYQVEIRSCEPNQGGIEITGIVNDEGFRVWLRQRKITKTGAMKALVESYNSRMRYRENEL